MERPDKESSYWTWLSRVLLSQTCLSSIVTYRINDIDNSLSFCPNCGVELKGEINFCPKCGAGLKETKEEKKEEHHNDPIG